MSSSATVPAYPAPGVNADLSNEGSFKLWTALKVNENLSETTVYIQNIGSFNGDEDLLQIKASWYGGYGWTTWVNTSEEAVKEAVASRSRGT